MHDLEIQFRVNLISAQETKENNLSSVHIVQWKEGVRAFLYQNMNNSSYVGGDYGFSFFGQVKERYLIKVSWESIPCLFPWYFPK